MRAAIQNKLKFLLFPFEDCIWISVGIRMSLIEVYCWQVIVLPIGLLFLHIHFYWLNLWNIHAPVFSNSCFTVHLKNYPWRTLFFPFLTDFVFLCSVVFPVYLREWDYPILTFLGGWAERLELFHKLLYSCCAPGTQIIYLELRIIRKYFL